MPVVRPIYKEGQILGAADLNTQLTYERLGAVLHERTEHTWGVAQGLTLQTQKQTLGAAPYVDVSVSPGRAVDRLGRSIVVTEAIPLDPDAFGAQFPSASVNDVYPVFVQAIEVAKQGETQPGKCGVALTTRIEERVQVSFGPPGAEISVLDQPLPSVADGFGTPTLTDVVLVGWVKFDGTALKKFVDIAAQGSNGTKIRYVGVVASDVVAPGGELALHTRPAGSRFALTVAEDTAGGCKLEFGKQDGSSPVVAALTVDDKGNITYAGTLTPSPVAHTRAESGVISDGLVLPLPPDVTPEQAQELRLHVQLVPLPQLPAQVMINGTFEDAFPIVVRCTVDVTDDRVVHCRVRWYRVTNPKDFIELPGMCTYTIIASGK
jgi:hypothetical protein